MTYGTGMIQPGKEVLGAILSMSMNTWGEDAKRSESGSLHWCPVPEQKTKDTTWKMRSSI